MENRLERLLCLRGWRVQDIEAVSYTHLDVYKRQEGDKAITAIYGSGTDLGWYWDKKLNFGDYSLVNSFNALSRDYWVLLYKIIRDLSLIHI